MINASERYIMMNYKRSDLKKKSCNSRTVIIHLITYTNETLYTCIYTQVIEILIFYLTILTCPNVRFRGGIKTPRSFCVVRDNIGELTNSSFVVV